MSKTTIPENVHKHELDKLIGDYLRNNLRVEVTREKTYSYWDSELIVVKLLLGFEVISEYSVALD